MPLAGKNNSSRFVTNLCSFGAFDMRHTSTAFRFLTALALVLVTNACAEATTTVELPTNAKMAAELDSRSVGGGQSPNLNLTPDDPLTRVQNSPTGTFVGQRTNELLSDIVKVRSVVSTRDAELQDIRRNAAAAAVTYHSSVAAVEARLQAGTTPGNPILLRQWDEAQANLDQMNSSISRLNTLSTEVSADGSMVGYLLGNVKAAFELNGAIDEDHDNLKVLQEIVSQQVFGIERMKTEISEDLLRLNSYLNGERSNLQTLAFAIDRGEYLGNNLANRPLVVTPGPQSSLPSQMVPVAAVQSATLAPMGMAASVAPTNFDPNMRTGVASGGALDANGTTLGALPDSLVAVPQTQNLDSIPVEEDNKLLALIRFNKDKVDYERQLYDAVSGALDQMPGAVFTITAVAPQGGNSAEVATGTAEAQRHADSVKRSLVNMGLPPQRIAMAATGSRETEVPEVRVMVR